MTSILRNDIIFILLFSIAVGVIVYVNADRTLAFLIRKSLGSRDEIFRILDLMFVEVDKKKITWGMLLISFGLGIAAFFALWPNFWIGLFVGTAITIAGWSLPLVLVKNMFEKRCSRFVEQMVDGLTIMGNGIKSGLSVTQCMERVVENMQNPISQEFALVLSQIRLGRSVEEALVELGDRIPKPDVQMFVTAINILKETGGNLAETFSTIVVTIRERQKIEKKIEAMTAQGLTQGFIVSMVPLVLMGIFFAIDPSFIRPMFVHPIGLVILIVIFVMIIIGGLTIRKIVKIKV
ncbi:MAG: hypothetical protein BroJett040_25440 [Oligoflexia bacterium]|nr:MAG: hypothetical protein BroJett040_25440 [Oligoflexia bacterium]